MSVLPKKTEDTITVILRDELMRNGVRAEVFTEIRTPVGFRKPDIYCQNGGAYVIEAKFREGDLWKAVAKIQDDYIRYHRFLGINGGFAILYPEELTRPLPVKKFQELVKRLKFKAVMVFLPEDQRKNFHVIEGTIEEIAERLAEQILTPPEFVEPSVDYIIKVLRDMAVAIASGLKHLTGSQLEDLFGGKHVFENILQYVEDRYPEEDLRLASAYILVNQLLFYHVLSRRRPDLFEEIDPKRLTTPSELQKYFSKVLNINYKTIFSYDVASRIPREYVTEVRMMVSAIQGLSAEKVGGDLLGTIFHDLIPYDVRKMVAAFYTNVLAADLLAWLAIDDEGLKVADFACGSGGLLVAAYRRKRWLLERKGFFSAKDHQRFVEEDLLGVDVMPFAANIAAAHLALQSPEFFTDKVKVAVWDSTELEPGKRIPSIAHLKFVLKGNTLLDIWVESEERPKEKGVVKLGEETPEEIGLEPYDVVIMNPPFTRQERIPRVYKNRLEERFQEYRKYLHGQMGYYGYFILLADRFLKDGGKMAFVLPAAFLRTKSAEGIRRLLAEKYHIEYVITGRKKLNFSEATWRREILLVARKLKEGEKQGSTLFVALDSLPKTQKDVEELYETLKSTQTEKSNVSILKVFHGELKQNLDWFRFVVSLGGADISSIWEEVASASKNLIKLKELPNFSALKRGIETSRGMKIQAVFIPSSEERAIRKEDVWVLINIEKERLLVCNREVRDYTIMIPKESVLPALRTIAGNSFMNLTGKTDFVVVKDFEKSDSFFFGERSSLKNILQKWEKYVKERAGNLIILRRFPVNAPGTIHLSYYSSAPVSGPGTTWVAELPDDEAKILCLWFNSSLHLAQIFRERIEDIWLDIHKYILEEMLVLNPYSISEEDKRKLLRLFDEVSKEAFPSLVEQYKKVHELKRLIDLRILETIGIYGKRAELLLNQLYNAIKEQFEALKELSTR